MMLQEEMRRLDGAADAADAARAELQHSMERAVERESILQERFVELTGVHKTRDALISFRCILSSSREQALASDVETQAVQGTASLVAHRRCSKVGGCRGRAAAAGQAAAGRSAGQRSVTGRAAGRQQRTEACICTLGNFVTPYTCYFKVQGGGEGRAAAGL